MSLRSPKTTNIKQSLLLSW